MLNVIFLGINGESLKLQATTLREIFTIQRNEKFKMQPVALRFESGKLLFYNENTINAFVLDENMEVSELVENCQCKAIYRNNKDVLTNDKITIESGALWRETDRFLELVDDDYFVQSELDNSLFDKIV